MKLSHLVLAAIAILSGASAQAQPPSSNRISLSALAETPTPAPGRRTRIAFRMEPQQGWHGYWSNPGDSGVPPTVTWTAPPGVTFGELQHPAPTVLQVIGLASYVHAGPHTLLADMTLPAGIAKGTPILVTARVNWLACSDSLCVPEEATVRFNLTAGDGAADPSQRALFRSALAALPRSVRDAALVERDGERLKILAVLPGPIDVGRARLFPIADTAFAASAPQSVRRTDLGLEFTIGGSGNLPRSLAAVLSDGRRSYSIEARAAAGAASAEAQQEGASGEPVPARAGVPVTTSAQTLSANLSPNLSQSAVDREGISFLAALLGALLGGLLLNVMPCVFPILSLKAMSLARAGESESAARLDALAYTAGTVLVCLALGAVLVGLKSAGVEVGWAFQLQDPRVVAVLLLLVTGIALNFAGLFEIGGVSVSGSALAKPGLRGSFLTGALSAFIATPCSGPFMATAVGAALLLPAPAAIAVFAGLGLGLALPFLAIGFVPALRRRLPKPGPWMATLRRLLALPMLATALGLAWVLGRQTGADGMTLGLGLVLVVAAGLWWVGVRQRSGRERSWMPLAPIAILAGLALVEMPLAPAQASPALANARQESFSVQRLVELRAQGVPVFVDFTADWCLSCKVNDQLAINRTETQAAFRETGVVTLVGDWTRGDPAITRFLAANGRNSIPYYLFFAPGLEPRELPQILSVDILSRLARASSSSGTS